MKSWEQTTVELLSRSEPEQQFEVDLDGINVTASIYLEARLGYGSIEHTRISAKIPYKPGFFIRIKSVAGSYKVDLSDPTNYDTQALSKLIRSRLPASSGYQCAVQDGAVSFWREEREASPALLRDIIQLTADITKNLSSNLPKQSAPQEDRWGELRSLLQARSLPSPNEFPTLEFIYQEYTMRLLVAVEGTGITTCIFTYQEISDFMIRREAEDRYQAQTENLEDFLRYANPNLMKRISFLSPQSVSANQKRLEIVLDGFVASFSPIQQALEILRAFLSPTEQPYR